MGIAKKIREQYECLFYPSNPEWLTGCSFSANIQDCRCLDSAQLNMAVFLYYSLSSRATPSFAIDYDACNPYRLIVYIGEHKSEIDEYLLRDCPFQKHHKIVKHEQNEEKKLLDNFSWINDLKRLYVACCLCTANVTIKRREDIFFSLLLYYEPVILQKYVNGLHNIELDPISYRRHVKLLVDLMGCMVHEPVVSTDDILKHLNDPMLKKNYSMSGVNSQKLIDTIKENLPKPIGIALARVPLDYDGTTLISQILIFMKRSEVLGVDEELVECFIAIEEGLSFAINAQQRNEDCSIQDSYNEMREYIDSIMARFC